MTDMDMLRTDVLIIGGGAAALAAAWSAAESGADVILMDAGRPGRSGSSATAGGGTAAAFGHTCLGEPGNDDTPDIHYEDTLSEGRGINDPKLVRVLADEIVPLVRRLTDSGVPYVQTGEGLYYQNRGVGQSRPRNCTPRGNSVVLCEWLLKSAVYRGAVCLNRTRAISLLTDEGRVVGALAMRTETGKKICISAGSVILAAGSATALMPYASAAFPTWGDSFRLAWEAGAELANMEFLEFTFAPMNGSHVMAIGGSTQLVSRGARFINKEGFPFLENDPTLGPHPTRAVLVPAFFREIKAGRGPILLECSSIAPNRWKEWESIGHPLIQLLTSLYGPYYQNETLAFTPALHCVLGGIVVDEWCKSSIPGLFAAGEAATGIHGAARLGGNAIAECLVFGSRAGTAAAQNASAGRIERRQLSEVLTSLEGESDVLSLENSLCQLRRTAWEKLGVIRNASELQQAVEAFARAGEQAQAYRAQSPDGLGKLLTLRGLALTAHLVAQAALERAESRGCHIRSDVSAEESALSETSWRCNLVFNRDAGMFVRGQG